MDSRNNAENTNNSQHHNPAQQHKQRPEETPRARGVLLWLVASSEAAIRHPPSPSLPLLCCACASGVSRAAKHNNNMDHSQFRKRPRCPISDWKARVPSSQRSCLFIPGTRYWYMFSTFFLYLCIYVVKTPDNKQHTSSAGCALQAAGHNAMHVYRPPAKQEATSRVCGSLSALYCGGFLFCSCFLLDPEVCTRSARGLCCCVRHACCHRHNTATAAAAVRFSWAGECGREFQPLLRCHLFCFCKYYPTTVLLSYVCHAWRVFEYVFLPAGLGFVRERLSSPLAPQQTQTFTCRQI